jgi:hypothetical protein
MLSTRSTQLYGDGLHHNEENLLQIVAEDSILSPMFPPRAPE